jgi:hypothetical protein
MPTVNVYFQKLEDFSTLNTRNSQFKGYFAEALTCGDIKLSPEEVSIRYIEARGNGMIGNVELEIKAHAFPERVAKQDDICRDARDYIEKEVPSIAPVKVWLQLSELGHSW